MGRKVRREREHRSPAGCRVSVKVESVEQSWLRAADQRTRTCVLHLVAVMHCNCYNVKLAEIPGTVKADSETYYLNVVVSSVLFVTVGALD